MTDALFRAQLLAASCQGGGKLYPLHGGLCGTNPWNVGMAQ